MINRWSIDGRSVDFANNPEYNLYEMTWVPQKERNPQLGVFSFPFLYMSHSIDILRAFGGSECANPTEKKGQRCKEPHAGTGAIAHKNENTLCFF